MTPTWRLRPHDPSDVETFARASGLPPIVAQLLLNRGVTTSDHAKLFLGARRDGMHSPDLLPGVPEAAERIVKAIRERRKIVVYGDYDVDGVCGTSVLWMCLKLAGASDAEFYIPHRVDEGYGLSEDALRKIVTEQHASMIITVDCGVSAVKEAKLARELGVELIITDHHTPGASWPEADEVVHPQKPGGRYPFPEICGAAVAFKLAWEICKSFGDGKKASPHLREFLTRSMDLVALATVADIMPLVDENRIFVRHGLRGIASPDAALGLRTLLKIAGLTGRDRITSSQIGFKLGPMINAAGRLQRASSAVRLLTTADPEEAEALARTLDECNKERQDVERATVSEAHRMIEASGGLGERGAIVVGHAAWHPGVIGIVAARLAEAYHRPTIVVALGETIGQGSARSVPGFHLYNALAACSDGLTSFGGHKAAAGLKIEPSRFSEFAERFDAHCRDALTAEHRVKELVIDAEVALGMLNLRTVDLIEEMEPFGIGNPRPLFLAERVHVMGEPRVVGEKKNHVQIRFGQGEAAAKAIAWNMGSRVNDFKAGTPCAVVFHPSINEWNGRREVQLEVRDIRVMEQNGRVPAGVSSSAITANYDG